MPKDCTGENEIGSNDANDSSISSERDSFYRDEFDDSDLDDNPYNSNSKSNNVPPVKLNGSSTYHDLDIDSLDLGAERSRQSSSSSSPSANIPLMRIVQSVKHTKRRSGQAIKEGWLVHFTNKEKPVKRHYWRLDSKAITMFVSDQGSKYYKEIPLNEILTVDTARNLSGNEAHCFQIRTPNIDYYVGQDPLLTYKAGENLVLPPPDSGIGAHLAKSWETAIRQAMMPVTSKFLNVKISTIVFFFVFNLQIIDIQERLPKQKRMYKILVSSIKYSPMKYSVPVNLVLCMAECIVKRIVR